MTRATTSADSLLAETEGAGLYYEIAGKGDPVLLIMGLGMASTAWWRTVPVLAKRLRVITFDNRGAGRSHAPRGPYTLAQQPAELRRRHGQPLEGLLCQPLDRGRGWYGDRHFVVA